MTRLLTQPEIEWREDGTPFAPAAGDVYFTAGDGLGETRAVFLTGCGLHNCRDRLWHRAELSGGVGNLARKPPVPVGLPALCEL
jgi:tRNA U34 5-methylaminomethyl-2-thiouridine-forming methyltransferase MnmC